MPNHDIVDDVLCEIRRIIRRTSQHSRQLSATTGLTIPQILCLRVIAEKGEPTVANVGAAVQLSAATTSRILDRLEKAGLCQRERSAEDRRRVFLRLTESGRHRLDNVPTPLQDEFASKLQQLPAKEQLRLLEALRKIVEMMEATDLDAAPVLTHEIDSPAE